MNILFINMFRLKPSSETINLNYIECNDRILINDHIYRLEKLGYIAAPQYNSYRNLKPGVYFISRDNETEEERYPKVQINSSSYVMKYLILKSMVERIRELGEENKLYLPRNWFEYSQVSCCGNAIFNSIPNNLFCIRQCIIIRIEHVLIDNDDALFLLADMKYRRFNRLILERIVKILLDKGCCIDKINTLLKDHYYSFREKIDDISLWVLNYFIRTIY